MTTNELHARLALIYALQSEKQCKAAVKSLMDELAPDMVDAEEELHIQQRGLRCPVCGDVDLVGEGLEVDDGNATQGMSCSNCGSTWTDTYRLTGFFGLEKGEA